MFSDVPKVVQLTLGNYILLNVFLAIAVDSLAGGEESGEVVKDTGEAWDVVKDTG